MINGLLDNKISLSPKSKPAKEWYFVGRRA